MATSAPRWRRRISIKASGIAYTILRSTQFFEFVGGIVKSGAEGDVVRLSPAPFQPIASDDVVANLAELDARTAAEQYRRGCGPGGLSDGQVRAQIPGRERGLAQGDR